MYDCSVYALILAYAEGSGHSTPVEVDAALMCKVTLLLLRLNKGNLIFPNKWL